jgi:hypothetical protein
MTHDPGAQKNPPGPDSGTEGGDSRRQILRAWASCGKSHNSSAPSPDPATTSPAPSTVQVTDDALACLTKRKLAALLMISVRSLDRSIAEGVIPSPDLWIGPSPRWTERTISRWLKTRPKLPGRGRKGGQS